MRKQNRSRLIIAIIAGTVTLISAGGVFGGVEWALASLGLVTVIGMIASGILMAVRIKKYARLSVFEDFINHEIPDYPEDEPDFADTDTEDEPAPIGKKDRKLIMKQVEELLSKGEFSNAPDIDEDSPVSKLDKKLIMAHIDEFFTDRWREIRETPY